MTSTVSEGIIKSIIESENSPRRFERLCTRLVSHYEGDAPVLRTSPSWDLGRDARGHYSDGKITLCVSLAELVDNKAKSDLSRLEATTGQIDRLYFCSSQPLSEHRVEGIRTELTDDLKRMGLDTVDCTVFGSHQLTDLAVDEGNTFYEVYPAEIEDCLAVLRGQEPDDDSGQREALRLALLTTGHESSSSIRAHIYLAAIRGHLEERPKNAAELARGVASFLHLAHSIPEETIKLYLDMLIAKKEVSKGDRNRYSLTDVGMASNRRLESTASTDLMGGRLAVRTDLEDDLGYSLTDEHYHRIWKTLQEMIADHFFHKGQQMVTFVARLSTARRDYETDTSPDPISDDGDFLESLARAIGATSSLPDQQQELSNAITSVFSDRTGPAADWLTQLCYGFVVACSLGLEATSGRVLGQLIARMSLVLDTDVVLSLLCEGEPNHESVKGLVRRWQVIGGQIYVPRAVVYESAVHAWIAENDYKSVKGFLPGSQKDRRRLISNAFVRAFATLLADPTSGTRRVHWSSYIDQYRGNNRADTSRIEEVLVQEHQIDLLPPRTSEFGKLENKVTDYLVKRSDGSKIARDKAERDATVFSAMLSHYRSKQASGQPVTYYLLSSSQRLGDVQEKFDLAGEGQYVITISAALYLLSLVPGVSIGAGALKSFLFDSNIRTLASRIERVVLRVIHESEDVDLPWARRTQLMREVRKRLLKDAREKGIYADSNRARAKVESASLGEDNIETTAAILRDSIASLALESSRERELEEENRKLREELERLKRSS